MVAEHAGRKGRPWRRVRAEVLAESTVCHICGHPGSQDVDHVIPRWLVVELGGDPNDKTNLRPAHGTAGCPTCGRRCNREKGAKLAPDPPPRHSRDW